MEIRTYRRTYVPTFNGKHNATKVKTWLVLYSRFLGGKRGLRLKELVDNTGISYKSLSVSLANWTRWRYVGFNITPKGREYSLRKRGREWLERWWDIIPK